MWKSDDSDVVLYELLRGEWGSIELSCPVMRLSVTMGRYGIRLKPAV
jgi:hypothetical protein